MSSLCLRGGLIGYSGFLPPSENMHLRQTGNSKLAVGVSASADSCLSLWPCGKLVTCPGFSPALAWWQLALAAVTLSVVSVGQKSKNKTLT